MPNDDLIDRRPLIEYFERLALSLANARCFNAADAIQGAAEKLRAAPAADAEPVRHGRWEIELDETSDCEFMRCSICSEVFYDGENDTVDTLPNYCPNCGAKMDKEE